MKDVSSEEAVYNIVLTSLTNSRYDLVFEGSDSDNGNKKYSKKDRRSSSEENIPELKR